MPETLLNPIILLRSQMNMRFLTNNVHIFIIFKSVMSRLQYFIWLFVGLVTVIVLICSILLLLLQHSDNILFQFLIGQFMGFLLGPGINILFFETSSRLVCFPSFERPTRACNCIFYTFLVIEGTSHLLKKTCSHVNNILQRVKNRIQAICFLNNFN